jgi:16S rRNA (cytidine1402-2'-O)-methyltransferase
LLRAVPVVAAEDTRRTRALLSHLDAHPRLLSYHAHSPRHVAEQLLGILGEGRDVALVSDAGTPLVSDPGAALVAEVRSAGFGVVPLPGPSAVTAALSAAGFPADRYIFAGFLPRKGSERARLLARAGREEWTSVFFEAPGRVAELLSDLVPVCGAERQAVVARELSKLHEDFQSGTLAELAARMTANPPRGECTIVVSGAPAVSEEVQPERVGPAARRLLAAGVSRRETSELLSELFGLSRNQAYQLVMEVSGQ